jgi:6-phosphogluconolactonase (cycloisomerase 2 family)
MMNMLPSRRSAPLALLLGAQASATILYAASYAGDVTSLKLTLEDGVGTLETLATNDGCASSPSWLTLDNENNVLYCADEGFATWPNGTIVAFQTQEDGTLEVLDSEITLFGAVSTVFYGSEAASGLAVAY